jgi:sulfur-carrier protein
VATVRFFAAARAAAGTTGGEHPAETLAELRAVLAQRYGGELDKVLGRSSYLVDGVVCHDPAAPLRPDATVDVLPPFAGG